MLPLLRACIEGYVSDFEDPRWLNDVLARPGSCPSSPMAKKMASQGTVSTPTSTLEASAYISPDPAKASSLRVVVDQKISLQ
jgi:hypothetical protein